MKLLSMKMRGYHLRIYLTNWKFEIVKSYYDLDAARKFLATTRSVAETDPSLDTVPIFIYSQGVCHDFTALR